MSKQLQDAIRILKETARGFKSLENEARLALAAKDAAGEMEKLRERAQLLVDLPDRLAPVLEGAEEKVKQQVLLQATTFATSAKEALEAGGTFRLLVLLTHQGQGREEKNDLEKLIDSLEQRDW